MMYINLDDVVDLFQNKIVTVDGMKVKLQVRLCACRSDYVLAGKIITLDIVINPSLLQFL